MRIPPPVVEMVPLERLLPWQRNPRKNHAVEGIVRSIEAVGYAAPILVQKGTYRIVAGHGRYEALKVLGVDEVPVIVLDVDDDKADLYTLADNKLTESAEWDFPALADLLLDFDARNLDVNITGFSEKEQESIANWTPEAEDRGPAESEAPAPPSVPVSREGDVWELGAHRLACADCTKEEEIDRLLAGEKADMVFTDPPYGVQYSGRGGDSIAGDISYTAIPLFFALLPRVLAAKAWVYVCGGYANMSLYSRMFEHYFRRIPAVIVWDKMNMAIRHNGYHSCYEFVYYAYTEGAGNEWYGERAGEQATDIWRIPRPGGERVHLTEKPVEIPRRAILNSCPTGGIVWEPFSGSGSTLIACEHTSRRCRAMEVDPRYVDVAVKRWQAFTGRKAMNRTRPEVTVE